MIYGLVEDGDTFQKGDELYMSMPQKWESVPEQWYGMKIDRATRETTFARFKMLVRRKLESK